MKKEIHIYILLLLFTINAWAQIGINTQSPKGLFYIDGKKDNTFPTTESQLNNDIMINTDGNLSIGTDNSDSKLNIKTLGTSTTTIYGLKIQDGTEDFGKLLTSDDNGNASWQKGKGSGGNIIRSSTKQTFDNSTYRSLILGIMDNTFSKIPIDTNGNYIFVVRWWGDASITPEVSGATFRLLKNSSEILDIVEYYLPTSKSSVSYFGFTLTLQGANLLQGDYVEIQLTSSTQWYIGSIGTRSIYMPSIAILQF